MPAYKPSPHLSDALSQNTRDLFKAQVRRACDSQKRLDIVSWVEANRIVEGDAEPGPKRISRTPYLYEIYRAVESQDPRCQIVCVVKGTQLGMSDVAADLILWNIDSGLPSVMYLSETADKAKLFVRTRLRPQFNRKPFSAYIPPPSKNTGEHNSQLVLYPGGALTIWGTGSTSSFSSTPARTVIGDEFARYAEDIGGSAKSSGEGSPLELLESRTRTFGDRKKLYIPSTPVSEEGAFMELAESGDMREYCCPCPKCGHMDFFKDDNLHGVMEEGKPTRAWFVCQQCQHRITERDKTAMLEKGEWRPSRPAKAYRVRSYHVPSFLSPKGWMSWADCYEFREQAKKGIGKRTMQGYRNLIVGLGHTPSVDRVEPEKAKLMHSYNQRIRGVVPASPDFATMAVDVHTGQGGWLQWEKKAWYGGSLFHSRSASYGRVEGRLTDPAVREEVDKLIQLGVLCDDGEIMPVTLCMVDAGDGATTREVMTFCAGYPQPVYKQPGAPCEIYDSPCVCGFTGDGKRLDTSSIMLRATRYYQTDEDKVGVGMDLRRWWFAVNEVKSELYNALASDEKSSRVGLAKFPSRYGKSYYDQLLSEPATLEKNRAGHSVLKFHDPARGQRNEALDTHVMNRCAAEIVLSDIDRNAAQPTGRIELDKFKDEEAGKVDGGVDVPPSVAAKMEEVSGDSEVVVPEWLRERMK